VVHVLDAAPVGRPPMELPDDAPVDACGTAGVRANPVISEVNALDGKVIIELCPRPDPDVRQSMFKSTSTVPGLPS
jgi:hypothetical protein